MPPLSVARNRCVLIALALAGALALSATELAAKGMTLGDLACTVGDEAESGGETGGVPGVHARLIVCSFRRDGTGAEEHYHGTVHASGALTPKTSLLWVVQGPDDLTWEPGLLEQSYAAGGATAPQAGKILIGQVRDGISLLPLDRQRIEEKVTVMELMLSSTAS